MPRLARIVIYPVKSLDGVALEQARQLPSGALEHDRQWAIFDALLWGKSFGLLTVLGTILVVAPTGWLLWQREEDESAALDTVEDT